MVAVQGDNVAMAKLIMMQALQSCWNEREMDWSSVGARLSYYAGQILGGSWNGGVHQWSFDCLQMTEVYVAYVEDKACWLGRNPGSTRIMIDENGLCIGC